MRSLLLFLVALAAAACSDSTAGTRPSGTPYGAIVFTNGAPNARLRGTLGQVAIDRATSVAWQNTNGATSWSRFISTSQIEDNSITVAKVADNAIGLAEMADVVTARIFGRTTVGTGDPEALTATQVTAMLDTATTALKGLVPASGGGTTNFLRSDLTWAAPPAGGGATSMTFATPTALAANTDNWSPTGLVAGVVLRTTCTSNFNITGLLALASGSLVTLVNVGTFNCTLIYDSASSTAANRFLWGLGSGVTSIVMTTDETVSLIYDGTTSRWRVVSSEL